MTKSVELQKNLENIMDKIELLRSENKFNEVREALAEAKNIKEDLEEAREEEDNAIDFFSDKYNTEPKINNMTGVKESMNELFNNAIKSGELIANKANDEHKRVEINKLVRGMITGDWTNAATERNYLNVVEQSGTGKILVPQHLSGTIYDMARAASAVFSKVPVIEVPNGNLTIAKVTGTPTGAFIGEGEALPMGDVAFEPVKLVTRTLGAIVPVSEKLLLNGQNVEQAIRSTIAKAIAETMDKALLYGTGDGTEEAAEPKGILTYENINKASFTETVTYGEIVKGVKPIAKANLEATDAVMNTDTFYDLSTTTNAQGDYIAPPKVLEAVQMDGSNNVGADEVLVFDRNSVIVGIYPRITLERGVVNDQFQKLQTCIRVIVGVDVAVMNEKGITHLTKSE